MRPSIKSCGNAGLHKLTSQLAASQEGHMHMRRLLVFAAGAVNNCKLLKQLGSMEASMWHEGRRSVDPTYSNPYWPD